WMSAGIGGYLAGRLRTKWLRVHTHEVFFKDTAHGFLAWALATLVSVALVGSLATSIVSGTASTATSVISGAANGALAGAANNPDAVSGYFVDLLYRKGNATGGQVATDTRAEAGRILATALTAGELTPADRTYLASLVAANTGLATADAEKRVDDVLAQANAAADK